MLLSVLMLFIFAVESLPSALPGNEYVVEVVGFGATFSALEFTVSVVVVAAVAVCFADVSVFSVPSLVVLSKYVHSPIGSSDGAVAAPCDVVGNSGADGACVVDMPNDFWCFKICQINYLVATTKRFG